MQPSYDELRDLQASAVASLREMSPDALDKIGYSGLTTLLEDFVKFEDTQDIELQGGWKAVYIGHPDITSKGKILLLPNHEWTRHVWRKGQIDYAVNKGLTLVQATKWLDSEVNQRHRFLDMLIATLANPVTLKSYLDYDKEADAMDALKWSAHHGINDKLTHPRRVMFVQLLEYVAADDTPEVRPFPAFTGEPPIRPWDNVA